MGDLGLIPGSGRSPGEATHSSTLAWKIPWMEEAGRLQSMGLQSWTQLNDFMASTHRRRNRGIQWIVVTPDESLDQDLTKARVESSST